MCKARALPCMRQDFINQGALSKQGVALSQRGPIKPRHAGSGGIADRCSHISQSTPLSKYAVLSQIFSSPSGVLSA